MFVVNNFNSHHKPSHSLMKNSHCFENLDVKSFRVFCIINFTNRPNQIRNTGISVCSFIFVGILTISIHTRPLPILFKFYVSLWGLFEGNYWDFPCPHLRNVGFFWGVSPPTPHWAPSWFWVCPPSPPGAPPLFWVCPHPHLGHFLYFGFVPLPTWGTSLVLGLSPVLTWGTSLVLGLSPVPSWGTSLVLGLSPVPTWDTYLVLGLSPVPTCGTSLVLGLSQVPNCRRYWVCRGLVCMGVGLGGGGSCSLHVQFGRLQYL